MFQRLARSFSNRSNHDELEADERPRAWWRVWARKALFFNFSAVYRTDRWLKRRFTPAGRMLLGALVVASIFGVNTRAAVAYQLAVLAFVLIALAIAWAPFFRSRFRVERRMPRYAQAGQSCTYRLHITNEGSREQRDLRVLDELTPADWIWRQGSQRVNRDDLRRNWFDRHVGYPRWAILMRRALGGQIPPITVPVLPAEQRTEVVVRFTPERRGSLLFGRVRLLRADPLGIFFGQRLEPLKDRLMVLPRQHPVRWPQTRGLRAQENLGPTDSNRHGGVEEFASIREFRSGDSPRQIHWRGWARYGYPVVKEFHDRRLARPAVIFDTEFDVHSPAESFEAAVEVVASLIQARGLPGGGCSLILGGQAPERLEPASNMDGNLAMLEALAGVVPAPFGDGEALREFLIRESETLDECVLVCLHWDESRQALLDWLRGAGIPCTAMLVEEREGTAAGKSGRKGSRAGAAADGGSEAGTAVATRPRAIDPSAVAVSLASVSG